MTHETREAIDEQQKQSETIGKLLQEIENTISYSMNDDERFVILEFINQFRTDIEKNAYPNTFSKDGETECCGKCGTVI